MNIRNGQVKHSQGSPQEAQGYTQGVQVDDVREEDLWRDEAQEQER